MRIYPILYQLIAQNTLQRFSLAKVQLSPRVKSVSTQLGRKINAIFIYSTEKKKTLRKHSVYGKIAKLDISTLFKTFFV